MKEMIKSIFIIILFSYYHTGTSTNICDICNTNDFDTEKDTIFWIDTLTSNKFLKIYTTPDNDFGNLIAEWGNDNLKNKIDLKKDELTFLVLPFTNRIKWITDKSFALVKGCGTNCRYVIIFNIEDKKPFWMPIEYYPNMNYHSFITDNSNVYIATNQNDKVYPSFVVVDTDTQNTDTINFSKDWVKGAISYFVDSIKIENSIIEIRLNNQEGKIKTFSKQLDLK